MCVSYEASSTFRCHKHVTTVVLQDIIARLLALARAEDKGVRLRTCQLLQLIINNQVLHAEGCTAS